MMSGAARVLADFGPQIVAACAEGRGEDLLFAYYQRTAEAFAECVFLRMGQMINAPTTDLDALQAAIEDFPHRCGLMLIESVASTCAQFEMTQTHQAEAERITAESYRARLQKLLDEATTAGSA